MTSPDLVLKIRSNLRIIIPALILICTFLFTRTYNITNSLEFFGDIGRDHLALWEWWTSGKPPLLGPGISYFALHLPPFYFYLNFPVFIISKFSAYSTLVTLIGLYIVTFLLGMKYCKEEGFRVAVLFIALLVTFHPQYILQSRLPWNPSFAPPFLFMSVLALLKMIERYTSKRAIIFAFGIAASVSLSLQTVPAAFVLALLAFIIFIHRIQILLGIFLSLFLLFFPLLFFEVRHNFFFLHRFLQNPIVQPFHTDMVLKLNKHLLFLFGVSKWDLPVLLTVTAFILIVLWQFLKILKDKDVKILQKKRVIILFLLFISVFILTYILPFPARGYDIFGTSVLLFSLIAFLPVRASLVASLLLLMLWINPLQSGIYFQKGHRTVEQMEKCATVVCKTEKEPMFISVQAWYLSHQTPEYQFLFLKGGCHVQDITLSPSWTNLMAVVADSSTYEHGKTSFNELTLFGSSKEERVYQCEDNLKVHILKKEGQK